MYSNRDLKHDSMPFFPLGSRFMTFLLRLFNFNYFCLSFLFILFLSFCCSGWPSTGLASNSRIPEKTSSIQVILATEFSTQISEHLCADFRLNWPNHSDLGIIGKIFSSCRPWVEVMPNLVKGDDIRCGTKPNTCHCWLRPAQASMG